MKLNKKQLQTLTYSEEAIRDKIGEIRMILDDLEKMLFSEPYGHITSNNTMYKDDMKNISGPFDFYKILPLAASGAAEIKKYNALLTAVRQEREEQERLKNENL